MGMSRSARITFLLVLDVAFFFVELVTGYAVGSLALVADSFHMLNDVLSLTVALYAIKLTAKTEPNSRYSYGWHRAEILAALVNGVFLVALCFSIFLESIERFVGTPEISNPRLIVVIGSLGLASNIVGLCLFHEHGHSHAHSPLPSKAPSLTVTPGSVSPRDATPLPDRRQKKARGQSPNSSFSSDETYRALYGHPAATRASLVHTAQEIAQARSPSPTARRHTVSDPRHSFDSDTSNPHRRRSLSTTMDPVTQEIVTERTSEDTPLLLNEATDFLQPSYDHSHHSSMNMRALVLHVLGDALGNVGVIATGLIIWKSTWTFKYYFDPLISVIIAIIIFSSALPLVRSASFILLQGVPSTISLEEVKKSILAVPGVLSLHELHVWQLSESKIVASVHVLAERKYDFMRIAASIRKVLHDLGIHSSTIQPEYIQHPLKPDESSCLILCPPDQACDPIQNACCPPPPTDV